MDILDVLWATIVFALMGYVSGFILISIFMLLFRGREGYFKHDGYKIALHWPIYFIAIARN